jgi:flagellar motor protein MotB
LVSALGFLLAASILLLVGVDTANRRRQARQHASQLLAEALATADRPTREDDLFRQARNADPTYETAPCQEGARLERGGHLAAAVERFRACVNLDPHQAYAHIRYGQTLLRVRGADSYLEVRADLQSFLEESENDPASSRDAADRRVAQEMLFDLEEILSNVNPHDTLKFYTAEELVLILLRPEVRGSSRYDGPRVPLRLGFQRGDSVLGTQADEQLQEVSRALRDGGLANASLQIEGHTDSVEGKTRAGRAALALRRANSVRDFLVQRCGIPAHRLSVTGFADDYPLASNSSEKGRAANRRVELVNLRSREQVRGATRNVKLGDWDARSPKIR